MHYNYMHDANEDPKKLILADPTFNYSKAKPVDTHQQTTFQVVFKTTRMTTITSLYRPALI